MQGLQSKPTASEATDSQFKVSESERPHSQHEPTASEGSGSQGIPKSREEPGSQCKPERVIFNRLHVFLRNFLLKHCCRKLEITQESASQCKAIRERAEQTLAMLGQKLKPSGSQCKPRGTRGSNMPSSSKSNVRQTHLEP